MPSRRKTIELTPEEVREYLGAEKTITIVSNGRDGYPHPMPMWFALDERDRVVCTTFGKSQKVRNWQRDPRATLLVESGIEYAELKGVMINADCEVVEDVETVKDVLVAINSKGRAMSAEETAKLREAVGGTASKRVVLRFTPTKYVTWDHAKLGGRY